MAITVYNVHCVRYGVTPSDIGQITRQGFSRGVSRIAGVGSGEAERQLSGIIGLAPGGMFETLAVGAALGIVGVNGAAISSTLPLIMFLKAYAAGGTVAAGSVHRKLTVVDGLVFPTRLRLSRQAPATIEYAWIAADIDGDGTAPVTIATGQALAGTTNQDEAWTLGPVTLNGTAVGNVQSVEIDFGIQPLVSGDGTLFPNGVAIAGILPTIRITAFDAEIESQIGETGLDAAATTVVKMAQVNKNTATSYSAGKSFTVNDGLIALEDYSGDHGRQGGFTATITPVKTAGTDLIVVAAYS